MLFLQSWLSYCNFDLNQISSFVLGWFVVFYLQNVHNYPSLQQAVSLRNGIILGNISELNNKFIYLFILVFSNRLINILILNFRKKEFTRVRERIFRVLRDFRLQNVGTVAVVGKDVQKNRLL